jgi:microcin C transport system permease protein
MRDYFLRRLLLIPPTLIGVTIIVFMITRLVPGGLLERVDGLFSPRYLF